jgi:hypothetical protein
MAYYYVCIGYLITTKPPVAFGTLAGVLPPPPPPNPKLPSLYEV